jgi:anti-sigma-K factor RskA
VTCDEFRESVDAYAMSLLEPEERAAFHAHLNSPGPHTGCDAALARATELVAVLSDSLPPAHPPKDLWSKIESKIEAQAQVQAKAQREEPKAGPRRTRSVVPWILTALAAGVALFLGFMLRQQGVRMGEVNNEERALLAAPGTQLLELQSSGPSPTPLHARVLYNRQLGRGLVVASGEQAPAGKDFELWVIRGGTPFPAGLLRLEGGVARLVVDPLLLRGGTPDVFAVTLEPAGGSSRPSTAPFLVQSVSG